MEDMLRQAAKALVETVGPLQTRLYIEKLDALASDDIAEPEPARLFYERFGTLLSLQTAAHEATPHEPICEDEAWDLIIALQRTVAVVEECWYEDDLAKEQGEPTFEPWLLSVARESFHEGSPPPGLSEYQATGETRREALLLLVKHIRADQWEEVGIPGLLMRAGEYDEQTPDHP